MVKKGKGIITKLSNEQSFIYNVNFWFFCLIIFVSQFLRGLFFNEDQRVILVMLAVIFGLVFYDVWRRRENFWGHTTLDMVVPALMFVYIISAFNAVNYGLAVDEILKNTILVFVFFCVSRLIREEKDALNILHVIYFAGFSVALIGLATATDLVFIKEGYVNGRIYSSYQYPNALASFLAAASIIGFTLWERYFNSFNPNSLSKIPSWVNIYSVVSYIILVVLWGSKSRGSILVFIAVILLYLLYKDRIASQLTSIHIIALMAVSYPVASLFIVATERKEFFVAWLWILAGALAIAAYDKIFRMHVISRLSWFDEKIRFKNHRILLFAGITAILGTAIILNLSIIQKILSFDYLFNAYSRLYFIKDAVGMILQRPMLGWGGGGWQEAYHAFQSYFYNSNTVHSYIFQVGVETGVPGMLTVIAIGFFFVFISLKSLRKTSSNKGLQSVVWCVTVSALGIMLHAMIDFDLSLIALAMILWTLFGINAGINRIIRSQKEQGLEREADYQGRRAYKLVITTLFAVIVFFFGLSLASSTSETKMAAKYLRENNLTNYTVSLERAEKYNPFDAGIKSSLAQAYFVAGKHNEALEKASEASSISQYNSMRQIELAKMAMGSNRVDAGIYVEKAVEMAPFTIEMYNFKVASYLILGIREFEEKNKENAREYLEKIIAVPELLNDKADSVDKIERKLWQNYSMFTDLTPAIKLNAGAANYLLGNYIKATDLLGSIESEAKESADANIWLSLIERQKGNELGADRLFDMAKQKESSMISEYDKLLALGTLR